MYAHASAFAAFHENGLDNRFQFIDILRRIYDKISGTNDKKKLALMRFRKISITINQFQDPLLFNVKLKVSKNVTD